MERNVSNKVREDRDFSLIDFDLIVREKRRKRTEKGSGFKSRVDREPRGQRFPG